MRINHAQEKLLYFADPMCSWCYGFSPVITALTEHFAGRLPVKVVMGGLRAGNTRPMGPQDKETIRGAWTHVHAATGQPFDFTLFRPRRLRLRHRAGLPRRCHHAPPLAGEDACLRKQLPAEAGSFIVPQARAYMRAVYSARTGIGRYRQRCAYGDNATQAGMGRRQEDAVEPKTGQMLQWRCMAISISKIAANCASRKCVFLPRLKPGVSNAEAL